MQCSVFPEWTKRHEQALLLVLAAQAYRSKLFFPYPENPVARRMCVSRCPDGLSDNLRVARALGLIERSASGDAERAGEESAGVLVGAEEQMPNCFLSKERPCFYPSYPTAEFLGRFSLFCDPVSTIFLALEL